MTKVKKSKKSAYVIGTTEHMNKGKTTLVLQYLENLSATHNVKFSNLSLNLDKSEMKKNVNDIKKADEIYYMPNSKHPELLFYVGLATAMKKPIIINGDLFATEEVPLGIFDIAKIKTGIAKAIAVKETKPKARKSVKAVESTESSIETMATQFEEALSQVDPQF